MTETVIVSPNYVGILETLASSLAASQAALHRIAAAANVPTDEGKVTTITVQQIVEKLEDDGLCKMCRRARRMRKLGPLHHGISEEAWEWADLQEDR